MTLTAAPGLLSPLTPPTPAMPYPHFSGFVTKDGRRAGLCWDEKPRCVNGHRLKTKDPNTVRTLRQDALVTCIHQEHRGGSICDARLYVALLTFGGSVTLRGHAERIWLVVEVTDEHVREMRMRPMIFLETMSLLQCVLPGVDLDLPGTDETTDRES